ncbi:MAG: hypothetical protein ABMA26_24950 [Limisphaerales bacterium]
MKHPRVCLLHWNAAEASARLASLAKLGMATSLVGPEPGKWPTDFKTNPPDAVVIDLSRLPSHGRTVGVVLRQQKRTRFIPLVFVAGAPEKVERVRQTLPDATFTDWDNIGADLQHAIEHPPTAPVAPLTECSTKPLAAKLGCKPGTTLLLLNPPAGVDNLLGKLPDDAFAQPCAVTLSALRSRAKETRFLLCFCATRAEFDRVLKLVDAAFPERVACWMAYPKKTSALATDLGEAIVRASCIARGLVDYKVCAINETWTGLLFGRKRS